MAIAEQDDPSEVGAADPGSDTATTATTGATATTGTTGSSRAPTILVVLATILAIVGTMTTWVRTQALNTDEWVAVSSELLQEPEVEEALATYLTNQLFTRIDVADELAAALPDQLAGLAGPIAGALRAPATSAVEELIAAPQFEQVWAEANRKAHSALVAVLMGESTTGLTTADGMITLDLRDVVVAVGSDLGVSSDTLDKVPADAGQVVLFQSDELASVQSSVRLLNALSWFLYLAVVGMYALAVFLGRGRRDEVLQQVGVGLLVAGVTVLLVRAIGIRTSVDMFVSDAGNQPLAAAVGQVSTALLRKIGVAQVVYGLLFIGFSMLLGEHRWAVASRRTLARWADSTAAIVVVALALVAGLWWWSPGQAFDHWVTALVLVALTIGAVAMLVARIRHEFPSHARTDDDIAVPGVGSP